MLINATVTNKAESQRVFKAVNEGTPEQPEVNEEHLKSTNIHLSNGTELLEPGLLLGMNSEYNLEIWKDVEPGLIIGD